MVTEVRLYFEGDKRLREGFHYFLRELIDKARQARIRFQLVPGGSAQETVKDFSEALVEHSEAWNILLLDHDPALGGSMPSGSTFWMVQIMESWFLADSPALEHYYGQGFRSAALRGNPNVEEIPKDDVLKSLKQATASTTKGSYHKTKHAPDVLRLIDPKLVRAVAPGCERLFQVVLAKIAAA